MTSGNDSRSRSSDDTRATPIAGSVPDIVLYDELLRNSNLLAEGGNVDAPIAATLRLLNDVLRSGSTAGTTLIEDFGFSVPNDINSRKDLSPDVSMDSLCTRLPDRFLSRRILGKGSFGCVYLASDRLLQRDVAIKVPHQMSFESDELKVRFLRESRALARLSHPNIVRVLDSGTTDGLSWQVTEYVDGVRLSDFRRQSGNLLPPDVAAKIVCQLADAVQHAHDHGVLHRDIKPDNVLMEKISAKSTVDDTELRMTPRLSDFGLARIVDDDICVSRTGLLIGTPMYMAPEQLKGQLDLQGTWTDIYSLGIVLYELLNETVPHPEAQSLHSRILIADKSVGTFRHLRSNVSADLETICLKCLRVDPRERYASAGALRDDLNRFLDGRPTLARPLPMPEQMVRWAHRNRMLSASIFAVTAALLIVLAQTIYSFQRSQTQNRALSQTLDNLKVEKRRSESLLKLAEQNQVKAQNSEGRFRTLAWNSTIRAALTALHQDKFHTVRSLLETLRTSQAAEIARPEWQLASEELKRHYELVFDLGYGIREMRSVPGTSLLVIAGDSPAVTLLDFRHRRIEKQIITDVPSIHALSISADGKYIAVGGTTNVNDMAIPMLYSLETGDCLQRFPPQPTTIESLLLTEDGAALVCGCRYEPVIVFDLTTGTQTSLPTNRRNLWLLEGQGGRSLIAHSTADELIVASRDKPAEIVSHEIKDNIEFCVSVPHSPLIACSSLAQDFIELRNTKTGQSVCRFSHAKNYFSSVAVSTPSRKMFAGREDGCLVIWDIPDKWLLPTIESGELRHADIANIPVVMDYRVVQIDDQPITSLAVVGNVIYCATAAGRVIAFRIPASSTLTALNEPDNSRWMSTTISQQGSVFVGERSGQIHHLPPDQHTRGSTHQQSLLDAFASGTSSIVFYDPNAVDCLTVSSDGSTVAWASWTQAVRTGILSNSSISLISPSEAGRFGSIDEITFSPDDKCISWSGRDGKISSHNLQGPLGRMPFSLAGNADALCYSPDGSRLACGGSFDAVVLLDSQTMTQVAALDESNGCSAISWDDSGTKLLMGFRNGAVEVRPLHGPRGRRTSLHRGNVSKIVTLSGSPLAVSVDETSQIALWNPETGESYGVLFQPNLLPSGVVAMEPALERTNENELVLVYDDGTGPQILRWCIHSL
jgi:serine/threonine protein kinase